MNLSDILERTQGETREAKGLMLDLKHMCGKLEKLPDDQVTEKLTSVNSSIKEELERSSVPVFGTAHEVREYFNQTLAMMTIRYDRKRAVSETILQDMKRWRWFDLGETSDGLARQVWPNMAVEEILKVYDEDRMPFPHLALSYNLFRESDNTSVNVTCFLTELPNLDIESIIYMSKADRLKHEIGRAIIVRMHRDEGLWRTSHSDPDHWGDEKSQEQEESTSRIVTALVLNVIAFMRVLNCKNIKRKAEPYPEKVNKKRARNGHILGYTKYTLEIEPSEAENNERGEHGESTGRHQRLHFRRGHIRRLPKGNIWVRQYWAGRAEIGFSDKDYVVKSPKSATP